MEGEKRGPISGAEVDQMFTDKEKEWFEKGEEMSQPKTVEAKAPKTAEELEAEYLGENKKAA